MSKKGTIVFTGGGTAGHVLPNFALMERFLKDEWLVCYIGSKDGIEKELVEKSFHERVKYFGVTCDKLRRYLTWKHLSMPFKLGYGFFETFGVLKRLKPDIIFSKGGFVSVSVILASHLLRKKTIVHESDYSVGLANKLAFPFTDLIAVSFEKSLYDRRYQKKIIQVGPLIRPSFLDLQKPTDMNIDFVDKSKKTLLILGGSLGAKNINDTIYSNIDELTKKFNIIHVCGSRNLPEFLPEKYKDSYYVFEYLHDGISYLMSISDLIISRAGVNTIWEILLMKKPSILIPLSAKKSRGDQIENAKYFEKFGVTEVIQDDGLNFDILIEKIDLIFKDYKLYCDQISGMNIELGDKKLYKEIMELVG